MFCIIAITTLTLIAAVYPGNIFPDKITKAVPDEGYSSSDIISAEHAVMQEFYPEHETIKAISVLIDSLGEQGGLFYFNLYDKDLNRLFHTAQRLRVEDGQSSCYYRFPIKQNLIVGEPYYYTIDYKDTSLAVCFAESELASETGSGKAYYALQEVPELITVAKYEYSSPLEGNQILILDLVILLIAAVLAAFCAFIPKTANKNNRVPSGYIIRTYLTECITVGSIFSIYQIVYKSAFSYETEDNIVFAVGVAIITGILLFATWKAKISITKRQKSFLGVEVVNFIQVIFWAKAILACIDFVNAGSNYAQGLALREICSWFGLAMIIIIVPEIIKNKFWVAGSVLYIITAAIVSYQYLLPYIGKGEPYETSLRTVIMVAVWGILIIRTTVDMITKHPKFSWRNVALTATFFVCLLLFRHSNAWELATVIPFSVFIIRVALLKDNERVLNNIANGVILSFLVVTYQSLRYRPFHYYLYLRYSGVFTTVTVTSVYLGLVFSAGVVKLIGKSQKSIKFLNIWKEIVLIGIVSGYQLLTLSRTGILTCIGVFFVAIVLFWVVNRKDSWKTVIKLGGLSLASVLLGAICVFTMTRTIPALVNEPYIYEIEDFQDSIRVGEPINSARYITVSRFFGLSSERIFGKSASVQTESEEENLTENNTSQEKEATVSNAGTTDKVEEAIQEQTQENSGISDELSTVSNEYSNGRFDIFKNYLDNLNLEGHDAVGLTLEDGTTIIHAHNSFIQMAYDGGILTGFVFIVLYIMLGFRSIKYYLFTFKTDKNAMMPVLIFAAFGIASLVEYVFRPTIPLGFVFLAMLAPLLTNFENGS